MRKSGKFGVILKVIYPAFKYKKNWNHVLKAHTEDIVTSKAKLETRCSLVKTHIWTPFLSFFLFLFFF